VEEEEDFEEKERYFEEEIF
jgi:hypothetical protein